MSEEESIAQHHSHVHAALGRTARLSTLGERHKSNTSMKFDERLYSENSLAILDDLFDQLLDESQRGAILIATSIVQEHLKKEVISILPQEDSKRKSKELKRLLLSFPGPMSSFSGLILLSYTFGYIDRKLFDSLNLLRSIRNDAAHTGGKFELAGEEYEVKFNKIFQLFENAPYYIHNLSVKALVDEKIEIIKAIIDQQIENEDERRRYYTIVFEDSNRLKLIENQKFHWILIYGTLFLCTYISHRFAWKLNKKVS